MTQWLKGLATKPKELRLFPGTLLYPGTDPPLAQAISPSSAIPTLPFQTDQGFTPRCDFKPSP